ncbi:MAG TPA: DUF4019 domain-containing protein [Pyrinomonadaceae bacterium]|jgi:hypothetical protein
MPIRLFPASFCLILLFQVFAAAQTVVEDRVAFTTAEAPWMVILDGNNFVLQDLQVKPDNQSGYLLMHDKTGGMTVSMFIEPVVKCKTGDECREFVLKTGNPAWGKFQNLVQSKIGDFSYFEFFRPTVQNQPLQVLDMYAEYVENGYWVDLHISKILYKKEDHSLFENFVKSVRFVSKTGKPATDSDKAIEAARKVSEDWMLLWDGGKAEESYNALSAFSQKKIDKKTFSTYWTAARKSLGKLKSRNLISISLVKSLEGIPGNSGAIFKYQSSFENREAVFETVSLILEKDGTWRVSGYLTND